MIMKKLLLMFALILLIGVGSIPLCSSPKSIVGLFANRVESLTDVDNPLAEIVVTGARTLYHFETHMISPYNHHPTVTVHFKYQGYTYSSQVEVPAYVSMYCCGDGYDDCHPFAPNKTPWKCILWKKGKNFWDQNN